MIKTYADDYDPEEGSASDPEMDDEEPPEMILSDRPKTQAVKTKKVKKQRSDDSGDSTPK